MPISTQRAWIACCVVLCITLPAFAVPWPEDLTPFECDGKFYMLDQIAAGHHTVAEMTLDFMSTPITVGWNRLDSLTRVSNANGFHRDTGLVFGFRNGRTTLDVIDSAGNNVEGVDLDFDTYGLDPSAEKNMGDIEPETDYLWIGSNGVLYRIDIYTGLVEPFDVTNSEWRNTGDFAFTADGWLYMRWDQWLARIDVSACDQPSADGTSVTRGSCTAEFLGTNVDGTRIEGIWSAMWADPQGNIYGAPSSGHPVYKVTVTEGDPAKWTVEEYATRAEGSNSARDGFACIPDPTPTPTPTATATPMPTPLPPIPTPLPHLINKSHTIPYSVECGTFRLYCTYPWDFQRQLDPVNPLNCDTRSCNGAVYPRLCVCSLAYH